MKQKPPETSREKTRKKGVSRRGFIQSLGLAGVSAPLLNGCASEDGAPEIPAQGVGPGAVADLRGVVVVELGVGLVRRYWARWRRQLAGTGNRNAS